MPARKYTDAQWAKARQLWDQGMTGAAVAKLTGVPPQSIYSRAENEQWKLHPRGKRSTLSAEKTCRAHELWNMGWSATDIAQRLQLTGAQVYYIARRDGWTARRPSRTRDMAPRPDPELTALERRCLDCLQRTRGPVCTHCGAAWAA